MSQLTVIQQPSFGDPCNRCGVCCKEEACELSRDMLHSDAAPCIALEVEPDGKFSCGLLKRPSHHLGISWNADDEIRSLLTPLWSGKCCSSFASE
jgi:hypothetical protein